ncbi:hypothetical protein CTI12_AA198100 [Artemisia annua]|uniref:DUF1682 domain-containing protein n=1 Tax=Artemisia annua TaxID=35608 RepID=A0A2U1NT02_ARTAN|nr:hypothetical protein CTI12_AA198100 [Artemisia annua]
MASPKPSLLFITLLLLLLHLTITTSSPHFEGFEELELEPEPDFDISLPPPPITLSTSLDPEPENPPLDHQPDLNPKPETPNPQLEYWDEEEFEGFPEPEKPKTELGQNGLDSDPVQNNEPELVETVKVKLSQPVPLTKRIKSYIIEIFCLLFLVLFSVKYFVGKKTNESLALAWATKFATRGTIFDKNFSLLGVGDKEGEDAPLLLKEGQNVFKFYASGRRYCQGLVATMELKSRHDLIASMYNVFVPCKDEIRIEVYMNNDAMDHVVFALGKKRAAKVMDKEMRDLQRFGNVLASSKKWVADELVVVSELKEVAADLLNESVVEQVFGEKAFEKLGKYFISMHFSDQQQSTHRKMLVFKFALPVTNHMADMTPLVALVPYYIDLIGRYKLSSQARSKTEAARIKVAQEVQKELQNARQAALQRKKAERRKMMDEAEAQLTAEILRKREEKERARQLKKAMPKIKMSRGG